MKRVAGFTLLEVCISMIIFGLIAGASIPLLSSFISAERYRRTELHKEQIISALASYLIQNNQLPCPSRSTQNMGIKGENCEQSNNCHGIVPYITLGLPENIAKDGFGNWFTYAVDSNLTKTEQIGIPIKNKPQEQTNEFFNISDNKINIYSAQTTQKISEYKNIAFVLISHGPKGSGAYHPDNLEIKLPVTNVHETFNSNNNLNFYVGKAEGYSHKVFIIGRDFFMAHYAQIPTGATPISPATPDEQKNNLNTMKTGNTNQNIMELRNKNKESKDLFIDGPYTNVPHTDDSYIGDPLYR